VFRTDHVTKTCTSSPVRRSVSDQASKQGHRPEAGPTDRADPHSYQLPVKRIPPCGPRTQLDVNAAKPCGRPATEHESGTAGCLVLARDHRVEEPEVTQTFVTFDAGIGQRRVLVTAEGKDSLIHMGAVEDVK